MATYEFARATVFIDAQSHTIDVWDLKGSDYRKVVKEVKDICEKTLLLDPGASFHDVAKEALADRLDGRQDAGLDLVEGENLPPYDASCDPLWPSLAAIAKQDRPLRIDTYGTRYLFKDTLPKGIQATFDAGGLRGKRSKATIKLRGTDPILQQTVRECSGFETLARRIVVDIESGSLGHIAIICRGGHHRSVTMAELLKNVYPGALVNHLTIDCRGSKKKKI